MACPGRSVFTNSDLNRMLKLANLLKMDFIFDYKVWQALSQIWATLMYYKVEQVLLRGRASF